MNKVIMALCLTVGLLSCTPIMLDPGVYDCLSAEKYVRANVAYADTYPDVWQSPQTTLEKGTGDCEDMAILWLYLVHESTGEKGTLWMGWWGGEKYGHAWATCGDYTFYKLQRPVDTQMWVDYNTVMAIANSPF